MATQSTPYALVYGVEAVLPLKIQIPSLRIAMKGSMGMKTTNCDWQNWGPWIKNDIKHSKS